MLPFLLQSKQVQCTNVLHKTSPQSHCCSKNRIQWPVVNKTMIHAIFNLSNSKSRLSLIVRVNDKNSNSDNKTSSTVTMFKMVLKAD